MTEKVVKVCVNVGHRRVGRPIHENRTVFERTRKFNAPTRSTSRRTCWTVTSRQIALIISGQAIWLCLGPRGLAVILDLHSRRVIGWSLSNRMKCNLGAEDDYRTDVTAKGVYRPQRPR